MKMFYSLIFSLFLAGCAREIEFKKEPLTGEEYSTLSIEPASLKNCQEALITLKYYKVAITAMKPAIRATLKIAQSGRDYNINSHEVLDLCIDGKKHVLDIISSLKSPREEVTSHYVSLPSGGGASFGTIKEVTRRSLSFLIPAEILSQLCVAKEASFEITVPNATEQLAEQYPIVLKFDPGNISRIQEFQTKCVRNLDDKLRK